MSLHSENGALKRRSPERLATDLWNLFISMKFAIIMLVILAFSSIVNLFATEFIVPVQGSTSQVYESYVSIYGEVRAFFLMLFQMHSPYRSWWFTSLLALTGISILICIIERTPNIYKKVFQPRFWSNPARYTSTEFHSELKGGGSMSDAIVTTLKKRGFKVRVKKETNTHLITGVKFAWALSGSWFVHIGFILLIVGGAMIARGEHRERGQGMPGELLAHSEDKWGFNVRVDDFIVEYYPLTVNQLVEVDGELLGQISSVDPTGNFNIEIFRPAHQHLKAVAPDRISNRIDTRLEENSRLDMANISDYVAILTIIENGVEIETRRIEVNAPLRYRGYRFYQSSFDDRRTDAQGRWTTILEVRKDRGSPLVWGGIILVSLGLIIGMYFVPRHVFSRVQINGKESQTLLAGKSSRNDSVFGEEFYRLVKDIRRTALNNEEGS